MWQADLLDQCAYVDVDEMATPRRVGVEVRHCRTALGETEWQRVEDSDRQRSDDEIERDGQQHERGSWWVWRLVLAAHITAIIVSVYSHR